MIIEICNHRVCVCVCVWCVCVCVCVVCLNPSNVKASSVCSWNSNRSGNKEFELGRINDAVLKTFRSCAKSLHRYFNIKQRAFITSRFILFTQQKLAKPRLN